MNIRDCIQLLGYVIALV